MIINFNDLKLFLREDKLALNISKILPSLIGDDIWKFQIYLRLSEYFYNKNKIYLKPLYFLVAYLKYAKGKELGFSIPKNVVGYGLRIAHQGTIVINSKAKIGNYAQIHVDVNIGANLGCKIAPKLGDYVYIGPGAKIFGNIHIADKVMIGANSVVNKSVTVEGAKVVGVPGRII